MGSRSVQTKGHHSGLASIHPPEEEGPRKHEENPPRLDRDLFHQAMSPMEPKYGIAGPGWKFVIPLAVLGVLCLLLGWPLAAAVPLLLAGYVLYFFRDPERKTPGIPNSSCSPADGRVASVLEVPCEEMPGGRAIRVAIFLNIFNVHVQRCPLAGSITSVTHRPGKKLNALNEKCSEENEAVTVWMDTAFGPVGIRQIAGAIARRIVCSAEIGQEFKRGERYGIIQFGSRVELFLPLSASVKARPGQKVVGGQTCLAVLFEEEVRQGLSREANRRPPAVADTG